MSADELLDDVASDLSLDRPRRVHLVGIGGAGMSAIARILVQRGHDVRGTDLADGRTATALRALGVRVTIGHDADHVGDAEVVVTSTAVPAHNVEVRAARERGILLVPRATMLAAVLQDRTGILVAGTHGKTTTTSMIVVALHGAGLDPTFAIGGELNESGTNAHAGDDPIAVAEADESDRSFLAYAPDVAVVTNIEHDHPETFADLDDVLDVFRAFLARRPASAPAVVCLDDPGVRRLIGDIAGPVVTYGTDPAADVRLVERDGTPSVLVDGRTHPLVLAVPGRHNRLNALAAIGACRAIGVEVERSLVGLARFTGAARRFQTVGEVDGVLIVDDYAHHPTELRATLAAARSLEPSRIVCVVQPHRYSRTAALGTELGRAAAGADVVVVTDVYGAGEPVVPGVTGALVADAAREAGARVVHEPHLSAVADVLVGLVREGDLVLVTGAGDVTQVGPALLARLAER
jgi:UDP-N-acetylmuramate--alanine ligase